MLSVIAGIASIIALLILSLANEYQNAYQHAKLEVENTSRLMEQQVLAIIQKSDLLMRDVQRDIHPDDLRSAHGVSQARKQAIHAFLNSQIEHVPEVAVIQIVDAAGNHIYSSLDPVPHINVADRSHFTRQRDDAAAGLVISPPLISRTTGKWALILTRRLNFEDGSFAGTVNVNLNMEYFEHFYQSIDMGEHGLVALYDKELRLAVRYPSSEKDLGKVTNLIAKPYIDKGIKQALYFSKSPVDGIERQVSYRQVGDLPLFVFAGIGKADYLAEWHKHIFEYSVGAVIFSLMLINFGWRQQQAEKTLRQDEVRFRYMLQTSPIAVRIASALGRKVLFANQRYADLIEAEPEQAIGVDPKEYYAQPEDYEEVLRSLSEGKHVTDKLVELHVPGDKTKWALASYLNLRYQDEPAVLGWFYDITKHKRTEDKLHEYDEKIRGIFECTLDGIVLAEAKTMRLNTCNPAFSSMTGYSREELVLLGVQDIHPQQDLAFVIDQFEKLLHGEIQVASNIPVRRKDGSVFYADIKSALMQYGGVDYLLGNFRDITDRKLADEKLRVAAAAFETHEAIMITNADANIIRVNQAFQNITGYHADDVVGKNPRILNSGRQDNKFYQHMWHCLMNDGFWTGEISDRKKNGQIYPKWMTITAVKDDSGKTSEYVAIFSDITERKQAENEIRNLAFYDTLTSLPNRRLLTDRLRLALSVSERSHYYGGVLFIDMDKFKTLNDTMGHEYGDLLLIEVARRIQACLREIDTVARLGGDEFVVLLEEVDKHAEVASQKVALIAEKIRASLAEPYLLKEHEYRGSSSIGVSLYRGSEDSVEVLLKYADMAMYQVKDSGRNAVRFFDPAMQIAVETHAALEADLRHAIPNKQLQLYYQIQIDSENRPLGAEALVRWTHPKRGMVSPMQFIPIAEESSLILDIGDWVLETACRQLGVWAKNEQAQKLILAVNVSAKQFKQHDFVEKVDSMLRTYDIEPSRLKLELTESVVLNDVTDVVAKMHSLKALGVRLSLDDFGTGYSSLSYLKRLPLDQLKIDQSFVRDIATDPNDAVMVQTIIDLAKNFRLNVIAEGVETPAQLDFLRKNGCLAYQGYLFSKPVPITQFEALLNQGWQQ